jgi:hypothetical protein
MTHQPKISFAPAPDNRSHQHGRHAKPSGSEAIEHFCGQWVRKHDYALHALTCPANAHSHTDDICPECQARLPPGSVQLLAHKRHYCTHIVNGCQSPLHTDGIHPSGLHRHAGLFYCMPCMCARLAQLQEELDQRDRALVSPRCQSAAHQPEWSHTHLVQHSDDRKFRCPTCHRAKLQQRLRELNAAIARQTAQ